MQKKREMLWNTCCCCSLPILCWDLGREVGSVLVFFWEWKEEEWLWYGGKVYDDFQILYDEFWIPVHLKHLFKIK